MMGDEVRCKNNPEVPKYLEAEYKALRDEIVKRIELRQHIVIAAVTIAGVFLGIGVQWNNTMVVMIYPFIAAFLAVAWAHHDIDIGKLGKFIRVNMEKYGFPGWETEKLKQAMDEARSRRGRFSWRRAPKSHCGILLSTQVIAIVIGTVAFITHPKPPATILIFALLGVVDAISVIPVVKYMHLTRTRYPDIPELLDYHQPPWHRRWFKRKQDHTA